MSDGIQQSPDAPSASPEAIQSPTIRSAEIETAATHVEAPSDDSREPPPTTAGSAFGDTHCPTTNTACSTNSGGLVRKSAFKPGAAVNPFQEVECQTKYGSLICNQEVVLHSPPEDGTWDQKGTDQLQWEKRHDRMGRKREVLQTEDEYLLGIGWPINSDSTPSTLPPDEEPE